MSSDPMDGHWARLDESPAASAQMIEWYAPETAAALRESALPVAAVEDPDLVMPWLAELED